VNKKRKETFVASMTETYLYTERHVRSEGRLILNTRLCIIVVCFF